MLARLPATATTNGVRVSWRPAQHARSRRASAASAPPPAARSAGRSRARSVTPARGRRARRPAGQGQATERDDHADQGGQPQPGDALGQRRARPAGADLARDRGGGAVGQEDAQADQRPEHRAGDAEGCQLRRTEVADDRGVGQQEQRLGDQREKGRVRRAAGSPGPGRGPLAARGRSGSLPRREPRRHQNLCKTRPGLWVTSRSAALSTNEHGVSRCRNGEHQTDRETSVHTLGMTYLCRSEPDSAVKNIFGSTGSPPGGAHRRAACSTRSTGLSTGACG